MSHCSPPITSPEDSTSPSPFHYNPLSALKEAYLRRGDYKGRSTRAAYCWALPLVILLWAIVTLLFFIISIFAIRIGLVNAIYILIVFYAVFCFYIINVSTSLFVRRFHDIGLSVILCVVNWISSLLTLPFLILALVQRDFTHFVSNPFALILGIIAVSSFLLTLLNSQKRSNKWGDSIKYPKECTKSISPSS